VSDSYLAGFLDNIRQAATDASAFIAGFTKDDFLADKRTQQAVGMSLVIIGESASKIMDRYPQFVDEHPDLPWQSMRNMRNRVAHGYYDINLDIVWETVQMAIPDLLRRLPSHPQ
jgi:uncharacterized protein with HEPN domain